MREQEPELLGEISQRLDKLLARAHEGHDVPPAHKHRLEGMMEAALICGVATENELRALFILRHDAYAPASLASVLGKNWGKAYPFPNLPIYMKRAPVEPSAADK